MDVRIRVRIVSGREAAIRGPQTDVHRQSECYRGIATCNETFIAVRSQVEYDEINFRLDH